MKRSAGTLLYRVAPGGAASDIEVLIVHPSGNYNRRAPWSIPKGLPDDGETDEDAARRETLEETGVTARELSSLGSIDYTRSRKRIFAFTGRWSEGDGEPHCASWEVDRAEFIAIARAAELIHPDQVAFVERLLAMLADRDSDADPDSG